MPKKQVKKKKQAAPVAFHAKHKDGVHHLVGIGNIRVVIVPDGDAFFAQGLEIDHAAQGSSIEEVKKNFEKSLTATIEQHLKIHGDIGGILEIAPPEVWKELLLDKASVFSFSKLSGHTIHEALPYGEIQYLVAAAACG